MSADSLVAVVVGSKSDWEAMRETAATLTEFGVPHEARVLSAHRTPAETAEYAANAERRGIEVIIAAAGGAAHLAGVIAAHTILPVLGVPMEVAQPSAGIPEPIIAVISSAYPTLPSPAAKSKAPASLMSEFFILVKPLVYWGITKLSCRGERSLMDT